MTAISLRQLKTVPGVLYWKLRDLTRLQFLHPDDTIQMHPAERAETDEPEVQIWLKEEAFK